MSLNLGSPGGFLIGLTGVVGFGEGYPRDEVPLLATWLVIDDTNLGHLVKVVFARFLHCNWNVPLLFPLVCSLGASHLKGELSRTSWRGVSTYILWNSSVKNICLIPTYLFIQSFIYITMD